MARNGNMRKVFVREILSGSNLDACYDLIKDEVIKAIEYVRMRVGSPVRIDELAFQTELNVILSMLWGGTLEQNQLTDKAGSDFRAVFANMLDVLGKPSISDFFPILRRFDLQGVEKEANTLLQVADSIFDAVINGRLKMSEDEMKTDTTATMHKEVLEKVQKELEDVVGLDNIVEEYHLPKLHYLEAVVKEALRLHPAVPLLIRKNPAL
ncbi:OLC1v1029388C1 [Oldenlandia corymbosa var. corymbosa]|uniref:OLC1v1029388C1 n=1 Tax=Oldenlandia corymbosa var. corymbosa TaxID=529605 RepID=A0AAV1CGQ8_OLDCO|nr:OLC1v1029388C1 [Oldenlandia corymbosa var. corymbosa]